MQICHSGVDVSVINRNYSAQSRERSSPTLYWKESICCGMEFVYFAACNFKTTDTWEYFRGFTRISEWNRVNSYNPFVIC